jgi:glycosyltransferase involved in cell wall biosynthesis
VFVGSFIPRKRILELLAAFERANEGRAELTLIGDPTRDPPYAARVLRALERSPELRAGVLVRGLVDDDALADALAEADALVLPSSLEGYGMVLTEAIHAGLPVIATRGGAVEEVVKDGAEALLCDGEEGLTQALRRFLGDEGLRSRMRAEAEARAPSLPAWDQTAAAVRAVLLRAARRDHRLARAEPPPPR